ncbi:MAG: hypothetical protein J6W60_04975, partial [Treponema sp.]|nr:hypothetical protein [Treponema sp.]
FLFMIFAFNSLLLALPVGLQDEFDQLVFDVRLVGGDEVFFGLVENEDDCVALFYDGGKAELNILSCTVNEYGELKKLAYGCKLLIKSVVTKNDYERKNIHGQIVDKLKEFGKFRAEDYDTIDSLGFIKISWYETELFTEYAAEKIEQAIDTKTAGSLLLEDNESDSDSVDVEETEVDSDEADESTDTEDGTLFFMEGFDWDSYSKELEDALKDLEDIDWSFLVD